jgi:hypothetical protein
MRLSSAAETEKDHANENQPQSQRNLLALPEPGSPERLRAERQLVRKLDTRILPMIFIITILNYIDVRCPSHRGPQS